MITSTKRFLIARIVPPSAEASDRSRPESRLTQAGRAASQLRGESRRGGDAVVDADAAKRVADDGQPGQARDRVVDGAHARGVRADRIAEFRGARARRRRSRDRARGRRRGARSPTASRGDRRVVARRPAPGSNVPPSSARSSTPPSGARSENTDVSYWQPSMPHAFAARDDETVGVEIHAEVCAGAETEADDRDGRVRDRAQRGGRLGRVRREQRRGRGGGRGEHEPLALDRSRRRRSSRASRPRDAARSPRRARRAPALPSAGASAAGSSPRPSGNETGRPSPRPPRFAAHHARAGRCRARAPSRRRGAGRLRTDSAAASPAKTPISAGAGRALGRLAPETARDERRAPIRPRRPAPTNGSTKRRSLRAPPTAGRS